jgi:hypothetical protein
VGQVKGGKLDQDRHTTVGTGDVDLYSHAASYLPTRVLSCVV